MTRRERRQPSKQNQTNHNTAIAMEALRRPVGPREPPARPDRAGARGHAQGLGRPPTGPRSAEGFVVSVFAPQLGDAVLIHPQEVGARGMGAFVVVLLAVLSGVLSALPGA